jgi:carboxymethylenebutenolidase
MSEFVTDKITLNVSDGSKMAAHTARPDDDQQHPGIIVIQEAFGVNNHIRNVTERFAQIGYVAIAPEMYHRTAPGFQTPYDEFEPIRPQMAAMTVEGIEADVHAAYQWLADSASVADDRIACIGYCMGGRVAYIANSVLPLRASVSYYGGGISPTTTPDGTHNPGLLHKAMDLHAPALFFWGGLDKHITAIQRRAVADAITDAGKPFINVVFSNADHGFFCDERQSYNANAAAESWALTLAFLDNNLK